MPGRIGRRLCGPVDNRSGRRDTTAGGRRTTPWHESVEGSRAVKFVLFTDNLADLSVARACESAKAAGFDGLDLTLRPGGHVRPEAAEVGLAEARRRPTPRASSIPMVSTAVTDVDSPHAESIFAAAAHYGARLVKLGYWEYRPFGTLGAQIEQARDEAPPPGRAGAQVPRASLRPLPLRAAPRLGRPAPLPGPQGFRARRGRRLRRPDAHDDRRGRAGWEMGLDLVAPWLALVGVKNFRWLPDGRDGHGQLRWRWEYCPWPTAGPLTGVHGLSSRLEVRRRRLAAQRVQGRDQLPPDDDAGAARPSRPPTCGI